MRGCDAHPTIKRVVSRLARTRVPTQATAIEVHRLGRSTAPGSRTCSSKNRPRSCSSLLLAWALLPAVTHAFVSSHARAPALAGKRPLSGSGSPSLNGRAVPPPPTLQGPGSTATQASSGRVRRCSRCMSSKRSLASSSVHSIAARGRYTMIRSLWRGSARTVSNCAQVKGQDQAAAIDGSDQGSPPATVEANPPRSSPSGRGRFSLRSLRPLLSAVRHGSVHGSRFASSVAGRAGALLRRNRQRFAVVGLGSVLAFAASRRPALASVVGSIAAKGGQSLQAMIPSAGAGAGGGVASAGGATAAAGVSIKVAAPKLALWFFLLTASAALTAAEIAITTLYPWKVKEFAEEEGENSPFQVRAGGKPALR